MAFPQILVALLIGLAMAGQVYGFWRYRQPSRSYDEYFTKTNRLRRDGLGLLLNGLLLLFLIMGGFYSHG